MASNTNPLVLKKDNVVGQTITSVVWIPTTLIDRFQNHQVIVTLESRIQFELALVDPDNPQPLSRYTPAPGAPTKVQSLESIFNRRIEDVVLSRQLAGFALLLHGGDMLVNEVYEHENRPVIVASHDSMKPDEWVSYWDTTVYRQLTSGS